MSSEMSKCKITVLKRTINRDLIEEYLDDAYQESTPCEVLRDGQEFLLEGFEAFATVPEGFCHWAWADIRDDILAVATGANSPGLKKPGTVITGCSDWFRPVIFKIERMEDD